MSDAKDVAGRPVKRSFVAFVIFVIFVVWTGHCLRRLVAAQLAQS